jgi:hypothetical protein
MLPTRVFEFSVKSHICPMQLKGMACAILMIIVARMQDGWRASVAAVRAVAVGLAVLALSACYSPTLPLPPPDKPESAVSPDGTTVTVDGVGLVGAQVFVFNTDLGEGVITTVTGSGQFHAVVPVDFAKFRRNTLEIWQRIGIEDSTSIALYCDRLGCQ